MDKNNVNKQITDNKIWCLFSIANNYDQPEHNLVGWFKEKPSIEKLLRYFRVDNTDDNAIIAIVRLFQGDEVSIGDMSYRFEEVKEGYLE